MFQKQHQGMGISDGDLLPLGSNPAFLFPGAENAAYGKNRCAGVIRQLLAAEWCQKNFDLSELYWRHAIA